MYNFNFSEEEDLSKPPAKSPTKSTSSVLKYLKGTVFDDQADDKTFEDWYGQQSKYAKLEKNATRGIRTTRKSTTLTSEIVLKNFFKAGDGVLVKNVCALNSVLHGCIACYFANELFLKYFDSSLTDAFKKTLINLIESKSEEARNDIIYNVVVDFKLNEIILTNAEKKRLKSVKTQKVFDCTSNPTAIFNILMPFESLAIDYSCGQQRKHLYLTPPFSSNLDLVKFETFLQNYISKVKLYPFQCPCGDSKCDAIKFRIGNIIAIEYYTYNAGKTNGECLIGLQDINKSFALDGKEYELAFLINRAGFHFNCFVKSIWGDFTKYDCLAETQYKVNSGKTHPTMAIYVKK